MTKFNKLPAREVAEGDYILAQNEDGPTSRVPIEAKLPSELGIATTALATKDLDGLMSKSDKEKLDSLVDNLTSGNSAEILLADGTRKSISSFLSENAEAIREAIGLATTEHMGLIPKLPTS